MIKKSIMLKMLMLFVSSSLFMFSQQNEIYNKIQINVTSKNPTKDAKTSFGGFFNEAKALVYFDNFWVEGRIGLNFISSNNWESGQVEIMPDRTHGNVGWTPFEHSEFVFGTQYYEMVPGTYMNAYEDALPDGRYGKSGATYICTALKDVAGFTFGMNYPIQTDMFTEDNFLKTNFGIIYESDYGINAGTTIYTNLSNEFSIGNYISGNPSKSFTWMVGYTFNGTGINGETPATHYFDSTTNIVLKYFNISADFEFGYNVDTQTAPLYAGFTGIYYPIPTIQVKLGILYNASDATEFTESQNVLFIYPRLIFTINNNDISIGPQFTISAMPNEQSHMGFSFPIYWKHSFQ